jgi:hypothetical protein
MSEVSESLEAPSALELTQQPPVPLEEQFRSLRSLSVSLCELHAFQMDHFYRSCPNLYAVEFKAVQASPIVIEKNLASLARSCPNLLSFKHLNTHNKGGQVNYSKTLLAMPTSNIYSITLSVAGYNSISVFGNNPDERGNAWSLPGSVTNLNIRDVRHASVILDAITTVPRLSQLTIDGYIAQSIWAHSYSQIPKLISSELLIARAHENEKNPLFCLPAFASQETLSYLDISSLDVSESCKLFEIIFRRIQKLKQLKFLKMARDHVIAANLHLTPLDNILNGGDDQPGTHPEASTATTNIATTDQLAIGEPDENGVIAAQLENPHANDQISNNSNNQHSAPITKTDDERVFTGFPTVEHLYLVDTYYTRFHEWTPFLTAHQASVLVRVMPKLRMMSFNREDAKIGLEGVIEAYPNVFFNFVLRQK